MSFSTPTYSVPYEPATLTLVKFISPLDSPGKPNKHKELYWMARVRDELGTEYTLFVNPPEREDFLADGIGPGDTFDIKKVGKGRDGKVMVRGTNVLPPESGTAVPVVVYKGTPVEAPLYGADGWVTSSFDNKLTPCLRTVPTLEGGPQEEIFRRLCNGVGDELADVGRGKALRMVSIDPNAKLTTAQASTLAPAVQATFATLVIAWKDLGYPITPSERARIELGGDADVDFD